MPLNFLNIAITDFVPERWLFECLFMSADAMALCCASFGQGSGPVHMSSVVCSGSEPNITSCSYSATSSGHQWDVGVQCQPGTIPGMYLHIL